MKHTIEEKWHFISILIVDGEDVVRNFLIDINEIAFIATLRDVLRVAIFLKGSDDGLRMDFDSDVQLDSFYNKLEAILLKR